ncbi:SSI family serine proteinase inhibitor [Actinomadura rubrisoli]|uniref:Subtilisin inhibitor domain-containing protein n=1 Tax=Actinomadura rubrisoli TaxID=2530368 RepID=A0A4R5APQ4_9ACTN|nr:SSI family serine proteinase inhibitor [Actinomadura rubrisoli]TDD75028.1 hypothetical protein E1298_31975 [Actinomadura rubrisoli]
MRKSPFGVAFLVALAAASPAHAVTPAGKLGITLYNLREGSTLRWSLTCSPDGGTHPAAGDACTRLRKIKGDLDELRYKNPDCPQDFDPREVDIRGTWNGRSVQLKERYPNEPCLRAATAPIVPTG